METSKNQTKPCPTWAVEQIDYLKQVEMHLGHISKSADWQSNHIKDIAKKSFVDSSQSISDKTADLLFQRISKGLNDEGFSPKEISDFINSRMEIKKGPAYCNEQEVLEAI